MDFDLMFTSFPKLLGATLVTLKLLSVSLFFGLFIGLLFAILRLNKNIFINKFAYGYSYVFRGTPLLVQIFIIYFGLGQIEYLRSTFLWVILKEPYWCAIIAFTLNTGAYTSEILRSAFQTIKPGIIEAGKSLGITNKIIFYKIQIPIAIRQSLPAYGNEIILMLYVQRYVIQSRNWLVEHTQCDYHAKYVRRCNFVQPEHWIVEHT